MCVCVRAREGLQCVCYVWMHVVCVLFVCLDVVCVCYVRMDVSVCSGRLLFCLCVCRQGLGLSA